jgi:hypothetical protein
VSGDPVAVVMRFGDACNAHDLDAATALCAPDIEFDGTTPPDGERISGVHALRAFWAPLFANPHTSVDVEETIVAGERVIQRCRYSWGDGHKQQPSKSIQRSPGAVRTRLPSRGSPWGRWGEVDSVELSQAGIVDSAEEAPIDRYRASVSREESRSARCRARRSRHTAAP